MLSQGAEEYLLKKSYEIAYALFRVAAKMEDKNLSEKFCRTAICVLDAGIAAKKEDLIESLKTVEYFVKFAVDINVIGVGNGEILLREVHDFSAAIAELKDIPKKDDIDVSGFFSSKPKYQNAASSLTNNSKGEKIEFGQQESQKNEIGNAAHGNQEGGTLKSEIRQSVILEEIRQKGSCRLRDLQEILPGCSERTIRYDIQFLVANNLIERVGTGGPSVYYRTRQIA